MDSKPRHVERPFAAYGGDEPYIFVSYAHRDSALVFPEIERLHERGHRIWYDEGISPGTEWSDELARRIAGCSQLLYFVTPNSVRSQHCRDEAFYALDHQIPFLAVHLQPTELPPGLQLRLGSQQALIRHELEPERYDQKLDDYLAGKRSAAPSRPAGRVAPRPGSKKWAGWGLGALLAAVALVAWLWLEQPGEAPETPGGPAASESNTLAVLPFALRSASSDNAYISEGMADTLVSRMQSVPQISVLSLATTAAYGERDDPLTALSSELGSRWVVRGSVQIVGDNLRITSELVDPRSGTQQWTRSYDGALADLFNLQDTLASDLAAALNLSLDSRERVAAGYQPNLAAYEQLILGRTALDRGTSDAIGRAVDHFRSAIELDPQYADAYVRLAEAYGLQDAHTWGSADSYSGMPSKRVRDLQQPLIDRALALDPDNGAAYAVLGAMTVDLGEAAGHFDRALALSPGYAPAYLAYADLHLLRSGNFQKAYELIAQAATLNPTSPRIRYVQARATWAVGQPQRAQTLLLDSVRQAPEYSPFYKQMARWQMQLGEIAHALRWIRRARQIDPDNPSHWGEFGGECYVLRELGLFDQADACAAEFVAAHPQSMAARRDANAVSGNWAANVPMYQAAIDRDPGNLYRINQLMFAQTMAGQPDAVIETFRQYFPEIEAGTQEVTALSIWPVLSAAETACADAETTDLCHQLLDAAEQGISGHNLVLGGGFLVGEEQARIHLLRGQPELALSELQRIRQAGWSFLWQFAPMTFAPLAGEPRFQAIMADLQAHIAQQQADYAAEPNRPLF